MPHDPWNDPWGGAYPPGGISSNDPWMQQWLRHYGGSFPGLGGVQAQGTPPYIPSEGGRDDGGGGINVGIPGVNVNVGGGGNNKSSNTQSLLQQIMPWLLLGTSLGTNLYSMIAGGNAAKDAAEIQSKSATEAANLQRQTAQDALGLQERMWQGAREDQEPWLNTGRSSLAALSNLMGLPSHGPETEYGPHTTGNLNMPFGNRPPMRNVGRGATPAAAITSRRPFMAARRRIG